MNYAYLMLCTVQIILYGRLVKMCFNLYLPWHSESNFTVLLLMVALHIFVMIDDAVALIIQWIFDTGGLTMQMHC